MGKTATKDLLERIKELEDRLKESEQLIEAIKAGEVDAFAIAGKGQSEVYTLQSGDYAYRVLIEEFQEGAINVAEDGLIVYTNPYFCELLNLPYDKIVGTYITDFIHPDSIAAFNTLFSNGKSGKSKGEINLSIHNTILPVYISLTSLQPKLAAIGIIITDLSMIKEHEKMILKYQEDLEMKNVKLVQNNAELASFTFIASHDMQEPLRKIQTFATRLMELEAAHLSNMGKDHLKRMQLAAERMQTLIEDLLAYSRTNAAERIYEYVNLGEVVEKARLDLLEELELRNGTIETGEMCSAQIIPFQFRQLFYNLFSNSLKFVKEGRAPHIKVTSKLRLGRDLDNDMLIPNLSYCHIRISDNGIGFDQQYSEKIFGLFQRLHGRTEFKGTGIGLAIVKKIVDNHNGIIRASGIPNQGATFDIYIPEAG